MRRDDDDLEVGVSFAQTLGQGESVQAGHSKIDEGYFRLHVVAKRLCFRRGPSLTHHVDLFALTEQEHQLVSRERLVIDDNGSKRHAPSCDTSHFSSSPVMMRGAVRSSSTVRTPLNSITDRSSCTTSSR